MPSTVLLPSPPFPTERRQQVLNKGALRLFRGLEILKFDNNSTDL